MNGYALYYKDKDFFEIPLSEFGKVSVFGNEHAANKEKSRILDIVENTLNPVVKYKYVRGPWWNLFKKTMVKVQPEPLNESTRELNVQIKNTLVVKRITLLITK